ncbi:type II secretion system F family protein [Microbacterium maritypicum]|uniref:type II secretion system F family protein n=1 Tax=Microbacterium maritypicum TaxID=33918 RepID=UPI003A90B10A
MNQAGITISIIVACVGAIIVLVTLVQPKPDPSAAKPIRARRNVATQFLNPQQRLWGLIGLGLGIVLFAVSGWLVMLIAAPIIGTMLPLFLSKGDAPQKIARLEALETWTRSLSGLTVGGAGLEQTLQASLASTPEAIKPQVSGLIARLNARWPTREALRAFAEDFDDPTADLVVVHLLLKEQARGSGLAEALDDLAAIIFEEVKVRRQIETDRAKPRTQVRIVTIATLVILAVLPFLGSYTAAYATPFGQILLAVWMVIFAVLLVWMRSISTGKSAPRILVAPEAKEQR